MARRVDNADGPEGLVGPAAGTSGLFGLLEGLERSLRNRFQGRVRGAGRGDRNVGDGGGGGGQENREEGGREAGDRSDNNSDDELNVDMDIGDEETREAIRNAGAVTPFVLLLLLKLLYEYALFLFVFGALVKWRHALDKKFTDQVGLRASCDPVAVSAVALASLGTALLLAAADYENTGKRLLLLPTVSPDLLDDLGGESGGESGAAGLTPLEGPALMDGGVNGGGGHIGDEDALRVGWVLATCLRVDLVAQLIGVGLKATTWLVYPLYRRAPPNPRVKKEKKKEPGCSHAKHATNLINNHHYLEAMSRVSRYGGSLSPPSLHRAPPAAAAACVCCCFLLCP